MYKADVRRVGLCGVETNYPKGFFVLLRVAVENNQAKTDNRQRTLYTKQCDMRFSKGIKLSC